MDMNYFEDHLWENENEEMVQRQKKIKTEIDWKKRETFPDAITAKEAVTKEGCWAIRTRYADANGCKIVRYRCNKVKARGEQCTATIRLVYNSEGIDVTLYQSMPFQHNHNEILEDSNFSETVKNKVKNIFINDSRIKPKKIIDILSNEQEKLPTIRQLNNFLGWLRRKYSNTSTISLGELQNNLQQYSNIPNDINSAFVLSYEISSKDQEYFRFFVSSKALLQNALKEKHIHVDGTTKLKWQGYPVLLIGTTDKSKQFHCFGIAVCSSENIEDFEFIFKSLKNGIEKILSLHYKPNILIADSTNIGNAFKNIFGDESIVITCWNYAKRTIDKKLDETIKEPKVKSDILEDLNLLHLSKTSEIFVKASEYFLQKWENIASEFIFYFKNDWLLTNTNWYEGISANIPSTNSALEATAKVLHDENNFRERLPIKQFIQLMLDCIEQWSKSYENNIKKFINQPQIKMPLWIKSNEWSRQDKQIKDIVSEDSVTYIIPGKKCVNLHDQMTDSFSSFEEYKIRCFSHYKVILPKDDYMKGTCDCPEYFKNFICKHIIGLAIRLKFVKPPREVLQMPVGQKNERKRGRPVKNRVALLNQ